MGIDYGGNGCRERWSNEKKDPGEKRRDARLKDNGANVRMVSRRKTDTDGCDHG